ncbi:NmrA family protein [Ilyonectria robusta]
MVVCTVSWISPEDKFSVTWSLVRLLIKTMARDAYEDLVAIGDYVSSIPTDQLAWTMMRLPNLTDGEPKPVKEAFRGDGKDGMSLTRASSPQWVLKDIDERKCMADGMAQHRLISSASVFRSIACGLTSLLDNMFKVAT